MASLHETLHAVVHRIPEPLISPDAWARVESVARILPDWPDSRFGFEVRLGTGTADADFAFFASAAQAREMAARRNATGGPASPPWTHAVWKRLWPFVLDWADPASPLFDTVHSIWLEFDVARCAGADVPMPGIFLALRSEGCSAETYRTITEAAAARLRDGPIPPEMADTLSDCFEKLPETAHVFQIGTMLSRPLDALRLCIEDISHAQILDYLQAIAWPGRVDDLAERLSELAPLADLFAFGLDVGRSVLPKIGVECRFADDHQLTEPGPWRALLDHLVDRGWCRPAKRDGLLAWVGSSQERLGHELWPSAAIRMISHVKIAFSPGQGPEAKAYFGVIKKPLSELSKS